MREDIYPPRTYGLVEHARCLLRREVLVIIPIYCLGLIPATAAFALLVARLDQKLGLPSLADWLSHDVRLRFFAWCLLLGFCIVSWSYTYLVLEGGGGPVPPFSASTRYLVTNGPYRYMRHPSLWGKLIGVTGLAVYVGSITFLTVIVPLLLYWSLSANTRRQDNGMERMFGDAYRAYRAVTPRMLPRWVSAWLRRLS